MATPIFYQHNSQYLEVGGLKDISTVPATYMNDATSMVATMKDADGNIVAGADSMDGAYLSASNGVYRFEVDPDLFNPLPGTYTVYIVGVMASGAEYKVNLKVKVKTRTTGLET